MQHNGWNIDDEGNIIVRPVVAYKTMIAAEIAVCLRLEILHPGDELQKPSGWQQLVMSPEQAKAIAQALLDAAARVLDQPKPPGAPS